MKQAHQTSLIKYLCLTLDDSKFWCHTLVLPQLFIMSTSVTAAPKRKRRQLSSRSLLKPNDSLTITPQKPAVKRRKRQLQPIVTNPSRSPSPSITTPIPTKITIPSPSDETSIPIKTTIPSPPKRSIRAASDAITKREQEKRRLSKELSGSPPAPAIQEEKKPTVKRRRKLNCKKVVMVPSSTGSPDELGLEDVPVDTYSKYLNPKVQISANITPVVIGVKKRKMIQRNVGGVKPPTRINPTIDDEGKVLDLSQHSILPNSSYIAHLSKRRLSVGSSTGNYSSDESCNVSMGSSSSSEFYDAKAELFDTTSQLPDIPELFNKEVEIYDTTPKLPDNTPVCVDTITQLSDATLELFDTTLEFDEQKAETVSDKDDSMSLDEEFRSCEPTFHEEENPKQNGFWKSLFKPFSNF